MQSPPFLATIFIVLLLLLLTACAKKIKETPTVPKLSPEEKVTQLGEQLFKKDFSYLLRLCGSAISSLGCTSG